eukprot:7382752-Prymnesium_polylepis.2
MRRWVMRDAGAEHEGRAMAHSSHELVLEQFGTSRQVLRLLIDGDPIKALLQLRVARVTVAAGAVVRGVSVA